MAIGIVPGEMLHKADSSLGVDIKVAEVVDAGWVVVYNMETGRSAPVNRNMLNMQLTEKKLSDGCLAFTASKERPPIGNCAKHSAVPTPTTGTFLCLLHTKHPLRNRLDELGVVTVCTKNNLANGHQVNMHMLGTHPVEWRSIQDMYERDDVEARRVEREEDRELQRSLIASISGSNGRIPSPDSPGDSPSEEQPPLYVAPKKIDRRRRPRKRA